MNENESRTDEIMENECEQIRFALFNCESLTDKQQKHIEECAPCRTFKKQAQTVLSDLKELGKDFNFYNGNIGVCDRVMDEIKRQEVFTGNRTSKAGPFLKHSGLIAACLVVAIMAFPVLKGTFLAGSKDAEAIVLDEAEPKIAQYSDNELPESAKSYDTSAESEAENATNNYFQASAEEYSLEADDLKNHGTFYSTEALADEAFDGTMYMYSAESDDAVTQNNKDDTLELSREFKSSGSSLSTETVYDGTEAESDVLEEDIYAVLNEYVLSLLDKSVSFEENFEIVYDSETEAHTEILFSDGRTLKVVLQKTGDFWDVTQSEMIFAE